MNKRRLLYSGIVLLFALGLTFFNLPGDTQKSILPATPDAITNSKINLGLDLQGGSQLDYKIDLRKVPEADRDDIVDGVISVIQKRVNGLGVAEPNIYSSMVGDEKHIIVELAGIKDLEEAKNTVGKTIQLEFKELREEPDPDQQAKVREQAEAIKEQVKEGNFMEIAGTEEQANPGKVVYTQETEFKFKDQVPSGIADQLFALEPGQVSDELLESSGEFTVSAETGQLVQKTGFYIIKLNEKQTAEKEINEPKSVKVAHILIAHKDAQRAEGIERTEEEARTRAEEVLAKVQEAEASAVEAVEGAEAEQVTFSSLAAEYSDDPGSKDNSGILDAPVQDNGQYVQEFTDASLAFTEVGQVSEIIDSPFGFHIIKSLEVNEAKNETKEEEQVTYETIFFDSSDDPWQETGLNGQFFQNAQVVFDQTLYQPQVSISFNPEGSELFAQITERNVGKPVAIFVGGELISSPNVNEKITGGNAVITGNFSIREAEVLARDLNTGAIPAPINLVGQYTIGASLGHDSLDSSLNAGLIGLALIAAFMLLVYRVGGLLATLALGTYTTLLIFLIKASLPLEASLPIAVAIFIGLVVAVLNGKDSGPEKLVSLVLACFVLFFLSFLLSTPVVLTLAGVAGVILSIGMAVDANILIFERIKEELRDGRSYDSAVKVGFDRAWSSIKDSNFSSLITCAILFYFGSSIIQGFAFNLAAGILVSMFTAITVTRLFLTSFIGSKIVEKSAFFGRKKKLKPKMFPIIKARRTSYVFSSILIIASLVGFGVFGLKLGLDFTGGSLMELKFSETVTTTQVQEALIEIEDKSNANVPEPIEASTDEAALEAPADQEGPLDLGEPIVITADDSIIIKSKDITNEQHDFILDELKTKFGDIEETRFQSVGPTVGQSMQFKAILAVLMATLAIIFYIAFAFRKVPRSVGTWRFGLTAIAALLHDIIIMLGVFVYLGAIFGVEIDALFITAMLTTMGFSVHDTIVVFDRLRERLKTPAKDKTFSEITNIAVNETVTRSINTSVTTALALLMLAVIGAESIRYFNIALLIGILIGTYSSIFFASPILVDWYNYSNKKK